MFVGDGPVVDVDGSARAGLVSVWLDRRGDAWPANLAFPAHTISSLLDLPLLLASQ
jgi:FMN phosphatase YigB (HAD superfamily)